MSTNYLHKQMMRFLEEHPQDELAVIWFAREEADWGTWYDEVDEEESNKFTDDEWAEIAGRFNDLDWQWVSEQFQEICDDVLAMRDL